MAKVILGNIAPRATTSKLGAFVLRDTKNGPVIAKRPPSRPAATEGYNYYREQQFALAARWASNPIDDELATAIALTKGTSYVPRDMLISAMYGYAYIITMPDGTVLEEEQHVNPNVQEVLEQLANIQGTILYRSAIGWEGLSPSVNGYVLNLQNGLPVWSPGAGFSGGAVDVQLFTANGNWTRPAGVQRVRMICVGGGAGGASGARRPTGTGTSGGSGGGGGALSIHETDAALLNPIEAIIIGAGGTPGASRIADNQSGQNGGNGGQSSITAGLILLKAGGGAGGTGGTTSTTSGGGGSTSGTVAGSNGGGCAVGGNGTNPPVLTVAGPGGGGGGAGMAAVPVTRNGGTGTPAGSTMGFEWTATLGGVGASKTNPAAALASNFQGIGSQGGGGGWSSNDGTAGAGAAGAAYGGGGGGGASSTNGNASGAGGAGSPGAALIISW